MISVIKWPLILCGGFLAVTFAGAAIMGQELERAKSRVLATLGYGASSSGTGTVAGLPDDVGAPRGSVAGLPGYTPPSVHPVNGRGKRIGLIYYPRIAGETPFPYIDRGIEWNLDQVLAEYPMKINYAFRPTWQQARIYAAHLRSPNPNGVAPPGSSIHEAGSAIDTNFRRIGLQAQLRKIAVFHRYGFEWRGRFTLRGLGGDPVHFQIEPERIGWPSRFDAIRHNQRQYRALSGDTR